jgi:hypothetical protein
VTHPFDLIEQAVAEVNREVGAEIVADVKDRLSVPVEYVRGPRGGTQVIRSKRGENPRRETDTLRQSIAEDVTAEGHTVTLDVSTDTKYAPFLDPRLVRPIFTGIVDEYEGELLDRTADRISSLSQ